jgi:HEAT repeat protein
MPLWPWLVAPALMLLLIVGFSVACLLLVNRGGTPGPQSEPEGSAAVAPQPEPPPAAPADVPADRVTAAPQDAEPETTPAHPPTMAPPVPTRGPQPALDLGLAANASDRGASLVRTALELPKLSETLRLAPPGEAAPKEVPRATPEREALYDAVVQRFILFDVGRLPGLPGRKAALDFEALGPDAIPALVRGLNHSATLDASCPVVSISDKLGRLLASCSDVELLTEVRDSIGKGVGPTLHHAYLTALKQSSAERLKKSKALLKPRVPQLVAALKSKDPATRRKAANTLGLAGAEAKAAVPALVEALKDSDSQARGYAASALAAVGPRAVPALLKAAEASPDRQVRGLAYQALGDSRPADDATPRALVAALGDPDREVRGAAQLGLIRLGRPAAPALAKALREKEAAVRRLAAETLQELGPDAKAAAADLVAALRDDDEDVRDAAGRALDVIDPDFRRTTGAAAGPGRAAEGRRQP